jgi:hypothetical protein
MVLGFLCTTLPLSVKVFAEMIDKPQNILHSLSSPVRGLRRELKTLFMAKKLM